ncbi:MAG TPA: low temperature requirement protein A [Polyangia bacterium]|nr:low temperature requirement protein A [Polyangia bacterium]
MTGAGQPSRPSLFRDRAAGEHARVTFLELFFDLIFVFAVTQLSDELRAHFSAQGVLETAMLMLAVWWVWIFTAWVTNWLEPNRTPVRLMMLALMFVGLAFSSALPEAFGHRGWIFAVAYASMQIGRTLFMLRAIPPENVSLTRNFQRVLVWLTASAVFWLVGGAFSETARLALWGIALAIEYVGPAVLFWVPTMGRSNVDDWNVEGGHLAERAGLFIIIALGESILVIGHTFAEARWTAARLLAFAFEFISSVAMWWLYFDRSADLGAAQIRLAANPGRLARLAYTYLHLPMVAGIVLFATGNEMALATPGDPSDMKTTVAVVGGAMVYLIGVSLFKHAVRGWYQLSHLAGVALLGGLWFLALKLPALGLTGLGCLVLVLVAVWEARHLPRDESPSTPS